MLHQGIDSAPGGGAIGPAHHRVIDAGNALYGALRVLHDLVLLVAQAQVVIDRDARGIAAVRVEDNDSIGAGNFTRQVIEVVVVAIQRIRVGHHALAGQQPQQLAATGIDLVLHRDHVPDHAIGDVRLVFAVAPERDVWQVVVAMRNVLQHVRADPDADAQLREDSLADLCHARNHSQGVRFVVLVKANRLASRQGDHALADEDPIPDLANLDHTGLDIAPLILKPARARLLVEGAHQFVIGLGNQAPLSIPAGACCLDRVRMLWKVTCHQRDRIPALAHQIASIG